MEFNQREYQAVILGALLHDIGKFIQKPKGKSRMHPDDGADFLRQYEDDLNRIGFDFQLINDVVSLHQRDEWKKITDSHKKALVAIVATSDGLASGERDYEWVEGMDKLPLTYYPLDPVFAHIDLEVDKDTDVVKNYRGGDYHYKHKKISFTDIFPSAYPLPGREDDQTKKIIEEDFQKLQQSFKKEFEKLLKDTSAILEEEKRIRSFLVSLYSLLYMYTWCVPDDVGREIRDISLFDHTRISAAIAACLYIYHQKSNALNDFERIKDINEKKFLLIAGDLSGIQDYLYNIANIGVGGVAKRFRTRSFFLSSLVEVVSHRILQGSVGDNIELPLVCKIMASGGNFIILAPNMERLKVNLIDIKEDLNKWFFKEFQGDLCFSFASLAIAGTDFEIKRKETGKKQPHESYITERLIELRELLEQEKIKKLYPFLTAKSGGLGESSIAWREDNFIWRDKIFPYGDCPSCKKNPATADAEKPVEDRLCKRCDSDRKFSEHLAKAKYISYSREEVADDANIYTLFAGEERHWVIVSKNGTDIPPTAYLVQTTDPADMLYDRPCFFSPYANYVPLFENRSDLDSYCKTFCYKEPPLECEFYKSLTDPDFQTKTGFKPSGFPAVRPFDCIAASSEGERLLGVLKVDIDRLRLIFSEGLGEERTSLSRVATLSRMVDLFFSGWIDYVLRNNPSFKETYTVYSGGDDLLLAGPWDKIIELSMYIADGFKEYVGCNPQVTISAGIAVTKAKFPVAKSYKLAEDFLKKSKEGEPANGIRRKKQSKNSLHLFGTTSVWFKRRKEEVEVVELIQWGKKILDAMTTKETEKRLSSGVVYSLLKFSTMCKDWLEDDGIDNLRYLPLMAYTIGRNIKDEITMKELKDFIDNIDKQRLFSKFRMPITWALLNYRGRRE